MEFLQRLAEIVLARVQLKTYDRELLKKYETLFDTELFGIKEMISAYEELTAGDCAEVIKYQDNNDGTITLTVNARCNDFKTPCLFTHEVTIRIINDSEYHYLSNKITYKSEHELPPNRPRLPPQRANSNEKSS